MPKLDPKIRTMLRIGITEDIKRLADALKEKVELDPNISVIWMCPNGQEALKILEADAEVDLILMDIRMPVMDGIEATREISGRWPQIPIVMSTVFDDEEYILQAILAGAQGYLLKDTQPLKIHEAIREALDGGAPMSPLIAGKALKLIRKNELESKVNIPEQYSLTTREVEILDLLVLGLVYQKIADQLFISYGTVRKHVEHIYRKLEVHGKVEAIRKVSHGK